MAHNAERQAGGKKQKKNKKQANSCIVFIAIEGKVSPKTTKKTAILEKSVWRKLYEMRYSRIFRKRQMVHRKWMTWLWAEEERIKSSHRRASKMTRTSTSSFSFDRKLKMGELSSRRSYGSLVATDASLLPMHKLQSTTICIRNIESIKSS